MVSWLLQRGRCKWCGERISARYPLTELGFALLTVLCLLRFDLTVLCLRNFLFLCCLFLLTLTDLEDMLIPDGCHIAAASGWVAALPFTFTGLAATRCCVLAALVFGGGLLLISLAMDRLLGRDSLGGGDIKLFAVVGLYLGFVGTLFAVMIACVVGLALHALSGRRGGGRAFPFGPSIALAAALMLLYGAPLVDWYRGLLQMKIEQGLKMAKTILGMDIGHDQLKLALVKGGHVLKTAAAPMPENLLRDGRITSRESMAELIRTTMKEARHPRQPRRPWCCPTTRCSSRTWKCR